MPETGAGGSSPVRISQRGSARAGPTGVGAGANGHRGMSEVFR